MPPLSVVALLAIVLILAWAFARRRARNDRAGLPFRMRTFARLTIIYIDDRDYWRSEHAYFEAPDFSRCRERAAVFLRAFARGDSVGDLYTAWPPMREPRDVTGADLSDEFRNTRGESTTYAFQPQEWVA